MKQAAHILSEITNLTAFALTPRKEEDTLKYINLLPVDEYTVVLMLVSESGQGFQHDSTFGKTGCGRVPADSFEVDDI